MHKSFLVRHYQVIFKSSLIEGILFLLLFSAGLVRYRFALIFIVRGFLSAISQYNKEKNTDAESNSYWQIINTSLIGAVFFSILMDAVKGQIYPKYPELPIWVPLVSIGIGYGSILLLHEKIGGLFQRMSGNVVFTVCPRCGYANIKVVEKCANCGYEKNISPLDYKRVDEISDSVKDKIKLYSRMGLYKRTPLSIARGLNLDSDESILISVKTPSLKLGTIIKNGSRSIINKFNERCPLNRVILTTKRICFITEITDGWKAISCHQLNEITRIKTENRLLYSPVLDDVNKMFLTIGSDEYVLRGFNPKKLFEVIAINADGEKSR